MTAFGSCKKVLALVAQNENGALHAASYALGLWLEKHGYTHQIINLMAPDGASVLSTALKEGGIAFGFGFAGVGNRLPNGEGVNIWTANRIPFLSFWYDHPAYNYKQHGVESPYVLHVYHVRDYLEAREKYLPNAGNAITMPMPLGLLADIYKWPWEERRRRFLFVKTPYNPAEILKKWESYPPILCRLLNDLAAQACANRNIDLADATAELFRQGGHPIDDLDNFFGVMQEVDGYVRAWRSDKIARALLPYPGRIIGRGWEYLNPPDDAKAALWPPMASTDILTMIKLHRMTVNANPLWRDGIHERSWYGIATGNILLSDRTEKFDEMFGHMPGYIGFDWQDNVEEAVAKAWEMSADLDGFYYARAPELRARFSNHESEMVAHIERAVTDMLNRVDLYPEKTALGQTK